MRKSVAGQGAFYIAKHLEETKGKDSFELIIDEGGLGIKEMYGSMFVLPGVGEKGKISKHFTCRYTEV